MSCGSHKRLAVLIAGLNVTITGNSAQRYGPKPHWDILRLFYENLAVYKFAAIHVDRLKGATEFDYPLDSSLDIVQLNRDLTAECRDSSNRPLSFVGCCAKIAGSDYVFIRFPSWVGLTAYRCARLLEKPYWVSVHGNWSEIIRNYELTAPEALTKLYYRLNRKCVENTFSSIGLSRMHLRGR